MRDRFGYELRVGYFVKYLNSYGIIMDDSEIFLLNETDKTYSIVSYIGKDCEFKKYKTRSEKVLYDKILKDYRNSLIK